MPQPILVSIPVDLTGKVAIVTGGAVRIGRAISLALASEGMSVCLHYGSSQDAAEQTAAEILNAGGAVVTVQADLAEPQTAAKVIFDAAREEFGQVDVLVNNASIFEPGTLADLTSEGWQRHQTINLAAPTFLCQQFASELSRRPGDTGAIINIADWRAQRPQAGHLAYTISKSGLVALTQILAQELAPSVRVNAIAPGAILPPPGAAADFEEQIASCIPLHRTGSPAGIVDAVLFLLRSNFVTGEVVHVTGGQQLTVQTAKGD